MLDQAAERLMELYPKIFFACHQRHVRDAESENVLTAHQASILDHLDLEEPMSLSGLARHMGVTPATMSVAVDRLERLGYVSRERAADDRRKVRLRLTPAGLKLREANSVLEPMRVAGMLDLLTAEERDAGLQGLEILGRAADRYLEAKGPGWKDFANETDQE